MSIGMTSFNGRCGNAQCAKALAMTKELATQHGLNPESLQQSVVDEEIAPVLHCRKSKTPNACKYGYEPETGDYLPMSDEPEHLKGVWKVFICERQKTSCPECVEHSGEMYRYPEEASLMPKLPLHPNCKCYYLTLGNESFLARRMSMDR